MIKLLLVFLVIILVLNSCSNKNDEKDDFSEIANPASQKCIDGGYELEIRTSESGNQVGYCIFSDGSECEEWAYFRGECE